MIAIILCAGVGSRLASLTKNKPKCLVEIARKPLLSYQLDSLREAGISNIILITGYLSEQVEEFAGDSCKIIYNKDYKTTNSIYSLWLAKKFAGQDDILLINGDIIFDRNLVNQIINSGKKTSALVDKNQILIDGEMNVKIKNGKITEFSKKILAKEAHALSLQITKFSAKDSLMLFEKINEVVEKKELDKFPAYAYDVIIKKSSLYPVYRKGGVWFEIDMPADLERAERELLKMKK